MPTFLLWVAVAAVCAVALWIGQLVKGLNDRLDDMENALDLILDHLKNK
jgi:hypothetical protein